MPHPNLPTLPVMGVTLGKIGLPRSCGRRRLWTTGLLWITSGWSARLLLTGGGADQDAVDVAGREAAELDRVFELDGVFEPGWLFESDPDPDPDLDSDEPDPDLPLVSDPFLSLDSDPDLPFAPDSGGGVARLSVR